MLVLRHIFNLSLPRAHFNFNPNLNIQHKVAKILEGQTVQQNFLSQKTNTISLPTPFL